MGDTISKCVVSRTRRKPNNKSYLKIKKPKSSLFYAKSKTLCGSTDTELINSMSSNGLLTKLKKADQPAISMFQFVTLTTLYVPNVLSANETFSKPSLAINDKKIENVCLALYSDLINENLSATSVNAKDNNSKTFPGVYENKSESVTSYLENAEQPLQEVDCTNDLTTTALDSKHESSKKINDDIKLNVSKKKSLKSLKTTSSKNNSKLLQSLTEITCSETVASDFKLENIDSTTPIMIGCKLPSVIDLQYVVHAPKSEICYLTAQTPILFGQVILAEQTLNQSTSNSCSSTKNIMFEFNDKNDSTVHTEIGKNLDGLITYDLENKCTETSNKNMLSEIEQELIFQNECFNFTNQYVCSNITYNTSVNQTQSQALTQNTDQIHNATNNDDSSLTIKFSNSKLDSISYQPTEMGNQVLLQHVPFFKRQSSKLLSFSERNQIARIKTFARQFEKEATQLDASLELFPFECTEFSVVNLDRENRKDSNVLIDSDNQKSQQLISGDIIRPKQTNVMFNKQSSNSVNYLPSANFNSIKIINNCLNSVNHKENHQIVNPYFSINKPSERKKLISRQHKSNYLMSMLSSRIDQLNNSDAMKIKLNPAMMTNTPDSMDNLEDKMCTSESTQSDYSNLHSNLSTTDAKISIISQYELEEMFPEHSDCISGEIVCKLNTIIQCQ